MSNNIEFWLLIIKPYIVDVIDWVEDSNLVSYQWEAPCVSVIPVASDFFVNDVLCERELIILRVDSSGIVAVERIILFTHVWVTASSNHNNTVSTCSTFVSGANLKGIVNAICQATENINVNVNDLLAHLVVIEIDLLPKAIIIGDTNVVANCCAASGVEPLNTKSVACSGWNVLNNVDWGSWKIAWSASYGASIIRPSN